MGKSSGPTDITTRNGSGLLSRGVKHIIIAGINVLRVIDGWLFVRLVGWRSRVEEIRQRLVYQSRSTDIFIVSYPKSGTTWVQMMIYQLMTDGSMDIPHISLVIPHLEAGVTPEHLEAMPDRRILKSHLPYRLIPRGNGKYIYVVRNGLDVAVSMYFHNRRLHRRQDTFEEFFKMFLSGTYVGSWFEHVNDWLRNSGHLDVLVVSYEELVDDLESSILRVAQFCGISLTSATRERIVCNCSLEFMRKHESKLDVALARVYYTDDNDRHLRKGQVGDSVNYVSAGMREEYSSKLRRSLSADMLDRWPGLNPRVVPER